MTMTPESVADLVLRANAEKRALAERLEGALEAARVLAEACGEIRSALGLPASPLLDTAALITEVRRMREELRITAAPPAGAEDYYVVPRVPGNAWSCDAIHQRNPNPGGRDFAVLERDDAGALFDLVVAALRLPVDPDEVSA